MTGEETAAFVIGVVVLLLALAVPIAAFFVLRKKEHPSRTKMLLVALALLPFILLMADQLVRIIQQRAFEMRWQALDEAARRDPQEVRRVLGEPDEIEQVSRGEHDVGVIWAYIPPMDKRFLIIGSGLKFPYVCLGAPYRRALQNRFCIAFFDERSTPLPAEAPLAEMERLRDRADGIFEAEQQRVSQGAKARRGKLDEALSLYERALALCEKAQDTATDQEELLKLQDTMQYLVEKLQAVRNERFRLDVGGAE